MCLKIETQRDEVLQVTETEGCIEYGSESGCLIELETELEMALFIFAFDFNWTP